MSYLRSVGAGQAELNDEDGLGGDDGVGGGVGRRSDGRVRAALTCHRRDRRDAKVSPPQYQQFTHTTNTNNNNNNIPPSPLNDERKALDELTANSG